MLDVMQSVTQVVTDALSSNVAMVTSKHDASEPLELLVAHETLITKTSPLPPKVRCHLLGAPLIDALSSVNGTTAAKC